MSHSTNTLTIPLRPTISPATRLWLIPKPGMPVCRSSPFIIGSTRRPYSWPPSSNPVQAHARLHALRNIMSKSFDSQSIDLQIDIAVCRRSIRDSVDKQPTTHTVGTRPTRTAVDYPQAYTAFNLGSNCNRTASVFTRNGNTMLSRDDSLL